MDSQAGLPLWVVLGVPALGLVVVTLLRWVPGGERLVVTRRDVVVRLHGPGLAWRLPWIEHAASHPEVMTDTPLAVRARTRDGRLVLLGLEADLEMLPVVVGVTDLGPLDPGDTAEAAIAQVASDTVAEIDVLDLPERLVAQVPRLRDEADRAARPRGVGIKTLHVAQIDVILDLGHALPDTARGPD